MLRDRHGARLAGGGLPGVLLSGDEMRSLLRGVLAMVVMLVLAGLAGTFIPRPFFAPETRTEAKAGDLPASPDKRPILVLANPIHTDIALPLNDETRSLFAFLAPSGVPVDDVGAQWLILGWGGRAFYLETPSWADLKPLPVLRAFTVDRSVLHVDVAGPIDEQHPSVTRFDLEPEQFRRLTDTILASFRREGGTVVPVPDAGYGQYDRFFEAHGTFNALVGCNTWTAGVLRAAGLRTGLWNPLPQSLAVSLKRFNPPQDD